MPEEGNLSSGRATYEGVQFVLRECDLYPGNVTCVQGG